MLRADRVVDGPAPTPVRLFRLRVWLWDRVAGNQVKAGQLRFRQRNAKQPRTCPCGAPGTVRVYYPDAGNVYGRPEWWRCERHVHVPLDMAWKGSSPLDERTCR